MKKPLSRQPRIQTIASCTQKTLLPLVAVGGSLAAVPAGALELGDAVVQSRLGQPLRASIAFALAPREQLFASCVSLGTGESPSGLPGIGRATISIVNGAVVVTGSTPIREPLIAANIVVNCPSTAQLSREYMMFIDLPGTEIAPQPVAQSASAVAARPAQATSRRQPQRAGSGASRDANPVKQPPIGQATRYQVQPGDSLSEITQRIENRSVRLWPAVNMIFEANPQAFIDNDPNKLKAGSWLSIPSFDGSRPVIADAPFESAAVVESSPVDSSAAVETVTSQQTPASALDGEPGIDAEGTATDSTRDLRPVEATATTDTPFVAAGPAETIIIPDVALQAPQTNSASPNVTTAAISTPVEETPSSSWLMWLVGAGVAVILTLLLFGRAMRSRFSSAPLGDDAELPIAPPGRPVREPESEGMEVIERVDWGLDEQSPTVENPVLDADLVMGTGLGSADQTNVLKEVGYPAPTEVDIELPFESPGADQDTIEIDTMSMSDFDSEGITVETEELPEDSEEHGLADLTDETAGITLDDDEDYDDFDTIDVEPIDETVLLNDNTVDPSIAFDILEQDYEDELSATQALTQDVAQAAMELTSVTRSMSDKMDHLLLDDDETAAMSLAAVTELDLVGSDDDDAANDDTDTALLSEEPTVKMPSTDADKTEVMSRKRHGTDGK